MPRQRIALGLEYDGSSFEGWQTQPHGRTVQDVLEQALAQFAGAPCATICAGRTDAGVHARGQVVHLDAPVLRDCPSWVRGVNRYLPVTVAVRWAHVVDDSFHARYSARARHYTYWIHNDAVRSPLLDRRAGWVFRPLDIDAMSGAAALLVGTHDFTSFRSAQCQAATPVRTLSRCTVRAAAGSLVQLQFTANAFLHHMVRNLVGALVEVGTARRDAAWLAAVLAACDRRLAAATIAAAGLYLTRVEYDACFGLPAVDDDPSTP